MEQIVKNFIEELGYDSSVIDTKHESRVKDWLNWYQGKTKYHNYYVYNGKKKVKKTLKSLNIATQACGDLSDFYFNEKLEITINNEKVSEQIKECLKQNDFLYNSNKLMQLVKALGTGAIVPYLDNDVLKINYIDATGIVILEADNTDIKSVLLWSKRNTLKGKEIKINAHILEEDGYKIYNRIYNEINGTYTEVEIDENLREIESTVLPKFSILKTPEVNNIDINSAYGISSFANATDTILAIDNAYDSLDNEISNGRKRIYIKGGATQFNTDSDGTMTPIFDSSETVYYELPGNEKDPLVTESNGDLRIDAITTSLQSQINLFTSKIGLGHEYYRFKDNQAYVNTTNIISANSDTYRKIKKQENIITNAIRDLCYAIAELIGVTEEFEVSVDYDDSIIEDSEQTRKQAMSEYNSKLISKAQYYRDVYKLDDSSAIDFAKKMNEEIQNETITDGSEFDITE